tara:strand:+ start:2728 stop:3351 length:624 start_codon:yes stop_codon:yes gene_type:complete
MAKVSVSKLVASGAKKATGAAKSVVGTTGKVVKGVASGSAKTVSETATKSYKAVNKVSSKLEGLCNPGNIIPCITAITIIAYIIIVTPATVLDCFSTTKGKTASMLVVLIALLFDLKMGVLLGLAVILSISLSSVNRDLYENFAEPVGVSLDSSGAPVDASGEPVPPTVATVPQTPPSVEKVQPQLQMLTGLDNHLASFAQLGAGDS